MRDEEVKAGCAGAAERVREAFRGSIPPAALAALVDATTVAHGMVTALQFAQRSGTGRRTFYRGLKDAGLPTPERMLAWGRVLAASAMLEDGAHSVEAVALGMGLSDSAALVHLFRHHTGRTPGEIREFGGFDCAIGVLRFQLRHRGAGRRP